jgi:MFS family permease
MVLGHINAIGTIVFVGGTLLGGLLAAKFTLRRVFVCWPFALNVPHITYFYLSHAMPTNLTWIGCVVLIEKFGYGLGTVGMMLYMMQELSPGRYRTAHYAFATGIMALNMMLTGMVSGRIQTCAALPDILRLRPARLDTTRDHCLVRALSIAWWGSRRTDRVISTDAVLEERVCAPCQPRCALDFAAAAAH